MELQAFQKLASAGPGLHKLNISVSMDMQVRALSTVFSYSITARGAMLPADVVVKGSSPEEAVAELPKAIAKARRAHETDKLLAGLEAEWTELEREGIKQRLHKAYGRNGFEQVAAEVRRQDKYRYDLAYDQDYEQRGEYDEAA
ncbi:hypothetical protein DNI29_19020 [Hymenobacter sediminis]|uniref:hypothetical protein n=1 Tax=Hymenobacter sediminis TaxID=2218621 RepID=UPI000DA6C12B|nr:hypothetical protein [Hymenobacter sediminis]RPD45474.1 hypothetical protein DNI29_19020 [Hymenobacter sediminis]